MRAQMRARAVIRVLAVLAVGGLAFLSLNSATGAGQAAADATAPPPAPAQPHLKSSINPVTRAAVEAGILSSASLINKVADYLTARNQSGVFLFLPHGQRDRRLFSASLEIIRPDGGTLYASASFAPNQENGAEGVYDTVEYVPLKPDEVEKTFFKDLKRVGVLKKSIVALDGGTVKVFLMPAGTGCIVIKKEVVE
jgi:hypothetical protein